MFRFRILLLGLCSCLLLACENKEFNIGEGWVIPNTRMMVIDTCTVKLSTLRLDSIATSGKNIALVGQYNDPQAGLVTASTFIELNLPSSSEAAKVDIKSVFDSITISLKPSARFFGDTLVDQQLSVHRLTQAFSFDDKGNLYNTSSLNYDATPLVQASFKSRPISRTRPIEIRLSDALGSEMLNKFIQKSSDVSSAENFVRYFKGLSIVPESGTSSILGYTVADSSFVMTLYYHVQKERKEDRVLKFKINNKHQFNRIVADRTGTPLAIMNSLNKEVVSTQTQNQAYVQSGVPLYAKIEFPSLNNLLAIGKYGRIQQALLYIRPVRSTYGPKTPLPKILYLLTADDTNSSFSYIVDGNGYTQTGNLQIDHEYQTNTAYTYDITSFLNQQLGVANMNKRSLQLIIPQADEATTVQRLVIGDQKNALSSNQIQLKITYALYNGEN